MESLYNRVSKGTIAMSEITESIKAATSEGGKFYKSMEAQSKTLNGQLSTLKDNANELLGSITSGLSSELAQDMLPLVNNIIAELQAAFDKSGLDGLVNAATDMIPDILGMMTGRLEDAISGLTRWLPNGINKIMAATPAMIKGASSALPQITNALFETASLVITDLIGMLPELVPALVDGVANMIWSVFTGIPKLVEGIFDGVEKAFHTVAVLGNIAVVFGAGADAEGFGIFRHFPCAVCNVRQHTVKAACRPFLAECIANIMPHELYAENGSDLHLSL